MTTYKIGGEDYTVQANTTIGGCGPEFKVALVVDGGDISIPEHTIDIFEDCYEPYTNEPVEQYAGDGMFWENGLKDTHKVSADVWVLEAASNLTDNMCEYFEWPELDDESQMKDLKDEVWDTVKNQYEAMYSTLIENAIKRGEIDPPTEVFICEVGQDYGVPCLIARNGTERHTLIVNIYRRVRDKDYDRATLIEEAKEAFTLPNCELDEDGLDYLLSEIEGRLAADTVTGDN